MNKKTDIGGNGSLLEPVDTRAIAWLPLLIAMSLLVLLAGCTSYRPLDQGARVPWAKALATKKGGPIDANRYRVAEGDSLGLIARRYGASLAALASVNNIEPPYILYPGEVLRIPAGRPAPPERSPAPRDPGLVTQKTLPPPEADGRANTEAEGGGKATADAAPPSGKRYVVGRGESLSVIAARHDLRLGELVAANGIEPPYRIHPGQSLIIPPSESALRQKAKSNDQAAEHVTQARPSPPLSTQGFLWPVDGQVIRTFEQNSSAGRGGGINIAARKGALVHAADNGVVAYAGEALRGYGQMIMLRHAEGYVSLYAHNDALLVQEGETVRRGQPIAEVGNSGDVRQSQLHFELRKGTTPIDPVKLLAGAPRTVAGRL